MQMNINKKILPFQNDPGPKHLTAGSFPMTFQWIENAFEIHMHYLDTQDLEQPGVEQLLVHHIQPTNK